MPDSLQLTLSSQFIDELLQMPTLAERSALLHTAQLFHADGVHQLLDLAAQLVRSDPARGRRLALICAEQAAAVDQPSVAPRATYLCAQAHALNAEYEQALQLMETARREYMALGEALGALRTYVGVMSVLIDLGRYQEALDAGQLVLSELANLLPSQLDTPETRQLVAFVQQNRGVCYEQIGRYDDALSAYTAAERRYDELGMNEQLGEISNNRGVVLVNLGRGGEALRAFEIARTIFAEAGLTLLEAQALVNIGEAHLLLSSYARSLGAFKQARQLFESLDALAEQHFLLRYTADAYLALNLYPEALTTYREAEGLLQSAGIPHDRARALWGMGAALIAQARYPEASQALAAAAELFRAAENLPLLSSVLLEQAALAIAQQKRGAALDLAQHALALVADQDWPVQHFYAHLRIAELLLPDLAGAEQHLLLAWHAYEALALPHLHYRLNQRMGHLRLLQGRGAEAQALLESAVDAIELLRGGLAYEAMRTSFLHDKVAAYEDLTLLYLTLGDDHTQRAFGIAERAKSRTLVDMLTGVIDAPAAGPHDPELAARLQLLQADLSAIYNELMGDTGKVLGEAQVASLYARASTLELDISRLRLLAAPAATAPVWWGAPLLLEDIQATLPPATLLVAYHIIGDEIMAFVGNASELHARRRLGTVPAIQQLLQRLAMQWDRFHVGRAFVELHMRQLEQSAQRVLAALYQALFAPLEPLIAQLAPGAGPHKLAIIPHGLLHQVPLHALYDGQGYLIDRYEISYAPSATVLALCQQRTARVAGRRLVVGVAGPQIPAVAGEVRAVAEELGGAQIQLDEQATLATLLRDAPGCATLHIACHGLFRADNPMFSALKLADGWLTATDVLPLDLDGALVTLSACESGRGKVIGGDEIVGLTRAFFGAGATTLVVSLWVVQDETTAELMSNWYAQLRAQAAPAQALRGAQLAIKAAHPHPYYWAPFVLSGKRA